MFIGDNHSFQLANQKDYQPNLVFRSVFQQYYEPLCLFADRLVGGRQLAEDIVADVFLKLFEKQPDFSQFANIKALLFIAVKNACLNQIKKQKRQIREQSALGYMLKSETEDFALNEITSNELMVQLREAFDQLPAECRKVMHLYFLEGWDYRRISEYLNLSVNTTRNHKCNGIRALRKMLGKLLLFFWFSTKPAILFLESLDVFDFGLSLFYTY